MPLKNTPETLNILDPDFRMPEHCGGDRWSILHGDSLQLLRQFEPNSFDAIITDPPYASGGSSQTTKNRSTNEKYSSMSKDKALPDFDSDQMDQLSWMFWTAAWLQDARRIAKPGAPVCLFIDWRQLPAMTLALQWAGWTWRGVAVWDMPVSARNPMNNFIPCRCRQNTMKTLSRRTRTGSSLECMQMKVSLARVSSTEQN